MGFVSRVRLGWRAGLLWNRRLPYLHCPWELSGNMGFMRGPDAPAQALLTLADSMTFSLKDGSTPSTQMDTPLNQVSWQRQRCMMGFVPG